jgi:hypothetical protein
MTTMSDEMIGKPELLEDGTWGASVRCGGAGAEMVGKVVKLVRKDHSAYRVKLVQLVQDWGAGDVAIYRVDRRISL